MKQCPVCEKSYYDDTLEFCLEDGSRLLKTSNSVGKSSEQTSVKAGKNITLDDTVQIQNRENDNFPLARSTDSEIETVNIPKKNLIRHNVAHTSQKLLETAPIIIALAHNYWQWLYLFKQPASHLSAFILSYNFLVWFFLLLSGLLFGIFSLKYGRDRGFAVTALVVMAINVILAIVPK